MQGPRHLRVFLSSPGDVVAERAIARRILSKLPYDPFLRNRITIDTVAWDDPAGGVPMIANLTPQEAINRGLPRPSECDVVVVILWQRLGTPLPAAYCRPDGSRFESGTQWEYEDALFATKQPVILVYRRVADKNVQPVESTVNLEGQQRESVQRFFDAFEDADGSNRGGVNRYTNLRDFEKKFDFHLREIFNQLLSLSTTSKDLAVETMKIMVATPGRSSIGKSTPVRVQVCLPASPGLLDAPEHGDSRSQAADHRSCSVLPILFRRDEGTGAIQPTQVAIDVFAPNYLPSHSTQDLLLLPSHDSGVVCFNLNPTTIGQSTIQVSLRQWINAKQSVTSGTVTLQSSVSDVDDVAERDDIWQLVSRLIEATPAASTVVRALDGQPQAKLTVKIVEETERKKIETYLTLDIPLLYSILPMQVKKDSGGLFSPSLQTTHGTHIFERLSPALAEWLVHDNDLFEFLREYPEISDVDLVLLIEDRIIAVAADYAPRLLATIIFKLGLHKFVGRHSDI